MPLLVSDPVKSALSLSDGERNRLSAQRVEVAEEFQLINIVFMNFSISYALKSLFTYTREHLQYVVHHFIGCHAILSFF